MAYDLPRRYRKNSKKFSPALLRGFDHFIYFNLDEPIEDADFSDWQIDLIDSSGTVVDASIGTLSKDIISGTSYRFYTTVNISASVPKGIYDVVVFNSSTNALKYQMDCVKVITDNDLDEYALFAYRNSTNLYNFNYEGILKYNTVFLPVNVIEHQIETNRKQYREQSTQKVRNQKSTADKVITVETYFFDERAHDMFGVLAQHDDIRINDNRVTVKEDYKVETIQRSTVSKGTIQFILQDYSTINYNG